MVHGARRHNTSERARLAVAASQCSGRTQWPCRDALCACSAWAMGACACACRIRAGPNKPPPPPPLPSPHLVVLGPVPCVPFLGLHLDRRAAHHGAHALERLWLQRLALHNVARHQLQPPASRNRQLPLGLPEAQQQQQHGAGAKVPTQPGRRQRAMRGGGRAVHCMAGYGPTGRPHVQPGSSPTLTAQCAAGVMSCRCPSCPLPHTHSTGAHTHT